MNTPKDVRKFLKKFKTTGFKNGDLVLTAEVHRVIDKDWGRKNCSEGMLVKDALAKHDGGRIMVTGRHGQQAIMKLK